MKKIVRNFFKKMNLGLTSYENLELLKSMEKDADEVIFAPKNDLETYLSLLVKSQSQLKQDLFVLSELNYKKGGFFVEFGATNGIDLSNSWLLEKEFGWTGILAEPAVCWHDDLRKNRSCQIEFDCVWSFSGKKLKFNEVEYKELSTVSEYIDSDSHKETRKNSFSYEVNTISLNDLLKKHNAPEIIDYLSIDTEGSELEILSNFDFSKHKFRVITCEHNYTPMRKEIHKLLTKNGYRRKFVAYSRWDDWYVLVQ